MSNNLVAHASVVIDAPISQVWEALVKPEIVKEYFFGTQVISDWKEGSDIRWKGEWNGTPYEDKGTILKYDPEELLKYTHFSPSSGLDIPENYHTVTIQLKDTGDGIQVLLSQDNNSTEDARDHSESNWNTILESMKEYVEGN